MTEEQLEKLLDSIELESPSMAFTRNVMEELRGEIKPVSLQTRVDKRIIYGISAVFVAAILGLIVYAGTRSDFSDVLPSGRFQIKFDSSLATELQSMLLKVFLFTDVVIALFYFDRFLRRNRSAT